MIVIPLWLRVALATVFGATVAAAQSKRPTKVFRPVIAELRNTVRIPILLPARLPPMLRAPEINVVRIVAAAADSYSVELRYHGTDGDAGFAAFFAGSRHGLGDVPGPHSIRLANGTPATFEPVHCGGSCGPANLWWQEDGVSYALQIELPFDMRERAQARMLLETANAMVRIRPNPRPAPANDSRRGSARDLGGTRPTPYVALKLTRHRY
jgi:hypothetical protein